MNTFPVKEGGNFRLDENACEFYLTESHSVVSDSLGPRGL